MKRELALVPVLFAALLWGACSNSTSGGGDEGGGDPTDGGEGSNTLFFVLDKIVFPTGSEVIGFDLDGEGASLNSCNKEDLAGNVDNQMGSLMSGLPVVDNPDTPANEAGQTLADTLNTSVVNFIADGTLLAGVEISGIDDFQNDSSVRLDIFALRAPASKGAPDVDSNNVLLANQEFDVDGSSLVSGVPVMRYDGLAIIDGRLDSGPADSAEGSVILLRAPLGGFLYELRLKWARVAFDLTENSISNGMIGGAANVATFGQQLECSGAIDTAQTSIADTLGLVADLNNAGDAVNKDCKSVSMGVRFTAVPAIKGGVGSALSVGQCLN